MKLIIYVVIFVASLIQKTKANWSEESRRIEAEQVSLWENKLIEAKQKPPEERPAELWIGLRNMGIRKTYDDHSAAVDEIYEKLQAELISIPGHAKYFADRVAAARSESKDIITDRNYHEACETLRDTLPHLPSPETVQVLGQMLENKADEPTDEQWIEFLKLRAGGGDLEWYYPAGMAVQALQSLEIRGCPESTSLRGGFMRSDVVPLRSWWKEVKSGRRTFSFKGQSVEYRFKPDGTWESLAMANPPDDAPKPEPSRSETMRPEKSPASLPPMPAPPASMTAASPSIYGWLIGCGILVLAALAVLLKRRHD